MTNGGKITHLMLSLHITIFIIYAAILFQFRSKAKIWSSEKKLILKQFFSDVMSVNKNFFFWKNIFISMFI